MSEAKGPYRHSKKHGECVASCNACIYEEGRASRDGLRKALEEILATPWGAAGCMRNFAKQALEADGETK